MGEKSGIEVHEGQSCPVLLIHEEIISNMFSLFHQEIFKDIGLDVTHRESSSTFVVRSMGLSCDWDRTFGFSWCLEAWELCLRMQEEKSSSEGRVLHLRIPGLRQGPKL